MAFHPTPTPLLLRRRAAAAGRHPRPGQWTATHASPPPSPVPSSAPAVGAASSATPPSLPPPPRRLPRRAALAALAAAAAAATASAAGVPLVAPAAAGPPVRTEDPNYTAMTVKRYLPKGRPASGEVPPAFDPELPVFKPTPQPASVAAGGGGGGGTSSLGSTARAEAAAVPLVGASVELQDVVPPPAAAAVGTTGAPTLVTRGALVLAHYRVALDDGTVVEDTRSAGSPVFFRAASGQVMAGVDAGVVGMAAGGVRRIRGVAPDMYSDITSGERSVVPASSTVYVTLEVLRINPYGPGV